MRGTRHPKQLRCSCRRLMPCATRQDSTDTNCMVCRARLRHRYRFLECDLPTCTRSQHSAWRVTSSKRQLYLLVVLTLPSHEYGCQRMRRQASPNLEAVPDHLVLTLPSRQAVAGGCVDTTRSTVIHFATATISTPEIPQSIIGTITQGMCLLASPVPRHHCRRLTLHSGVQSSTELM